MHFKEDLAKKLSDAGMAPIAAEVAALSREAFRIQTSAATDETLPIGASKLGGLPDLPANIAWPDCEGAPFQIFAVRRLALVPFQSIPDPCAKLLERPLRTLEDQDMYANFFDEYSHQGPAHRLLGWPTLMQNEMELECQMVTNGIYRGDTSGYKHPRRPELEKGAQDWILLLQVDSDDDAQMMWGDAGMLYFWIRRQDLERSDFGNAWCILQCH